MYVLREDLVEETGVKPATPVPNQDHFAVQLKPNSALRRHTPQSLVAHPPLGVRVGEPIVSENDCQPGHSLPNRAKKAGTRPAPKS